MNTQEYEAKIQELEDKKRDYRIRLVHSTTANLALLTTSKTALCYVSPDEDKTIRYIPNGEMIFGETDNISHVRDLFKTPAATQYFNTIADLSESMKTFETLAANVPWKRIFSSEPPYQGNLTDWIAWPTDQMEVEKNMAWAKPGSPAGWHILMSPRGLIGPDDDFRIEYKARADGNPQDLSLLVGHCPHRIRVAHILIQAPEACSYSFVFGGMSNSLTEIRRDGLAAMVNNETRIQRGHDYHCVAERIGGVLKFTIDGIEVCRVIDALPHIGENYDHVSLYAWGDDHRFWDVSVLTRPTCVPYQTRQHISALRQVTLENKEGPARFVDVYYMGRIDFHVSHLFVFKDVTDVVEERQRQEAQRQYAEKMEVILQVAGAAAHELNQPLTTIVGNIDLIKKYLPASMPPSLVQSLKEITEGSMRMSDIVKKIGSINKYKTKPYVGNVNILDIEASSATVYKSRD